MPVTSRLAAVLILLTVIAAWPASAAAQVVARENFDYPVGELVGRNDGEGWRSAWAGNLELTKTSGTNNLKITAPGDAYPDGSRAEMGESGGKGGLLYRGIARPLTTGQTYYISMRLQKIIQNDKSRFFGLALFEDDDERLIIGQNSGTANFDVGNVRVTEKKTSLISDVKSTLASLLVVRLDLTDGMDGVTFWVNPDLSKPESTNTAVGGKAYPTMEDCGSINGVRIGSGGSLEDVSNSPHWMDNILISTDSPFAH
ncbi:MAG: hypothetical protein IT445_08905 [Phycisphaeraceae bacterium]|nr:hypothetical protein [Phycisphaeraceae bacterium]